MEDFFEIANQRAKSLEDLRAAVQEVLNTTAEAQRSHEDAASKNSLFDAANTWLTIGRKDAFEKGIKKGYANAAADIVPVLEAIIAKIRSQELELQSLMREIKEEEKQTEEELNDLDENENSGGLDNLVPLDLSES